MSEESKTYTVAELAKTTSVQEQTIRKYIHYFDIPAEKIGRKTYLKKDAVKYILEVVRLRANGMTLKQIKELASSPSPIKEDIQTELIPEESTEDNPESPQNEAVETASPQIYSNENTNIQVISSPEVPSNVSYDQVTEDTLSQEDSPSPINENIHLSKDLNEHLFTRDYINKEITNQARKVSRLQRFLSSKHSNKEIAEIKANLDRRYVFLAGLRYIRDNWLIRGQNTSTPQK